MSGYPLSVSHLRTILHSDHLNYYECWEKRANKVMDHLPSLFSILSGKEVLKKKKIKFTFFEEFSDCRHSLLVLGSDPALQQCFPDFKFQES